MEYIFQAIGIGFLLSVMVGPVFFVLLETSITKGARSALMLDLGVFISDIIYIDARKNKIFKKIGFVFKIRFIFYTTY